MFNQECFKKHVLQFFLGKVSSLLIVFTNLMIQVLTLKKTMGLIHKQSEISKEAFLLKLLLSRF